MADPAGRVVVLGSLNIDLVARVARHPAAGETILATGFERLPGGKGANQAVAAAAAGARCRLVGRVGDDAAGRRYVEGLTARAVGVDDVRVAEGHPTGTALIVVDDAGDNTIVVVAGANNEVGPDDVQRAVDGLRAGDILLCQLEIPTDVVAAAAAAAADAGARFVLNASPVRELPAGLLELADPVVVNDAEAAALDGRARSVVRTAGAAGARWGAHEVAAPAVPVVDTTGAGDAFTGALAAALARGEDAATALQVAVVAGAESVRVPGAQGWSLDP